MDDLAREEWGQFLERYRGVVEFIERTCPGFWRDAADVLDSLRRQAVTTHGAVAREFPPVQERGAQTDLVGRIIPRRRDVQVQVHIRARRADRALQTDPPLTCDAWQQTGRTTRENAAQTDLPPPGEGWPWIRVMGTTRATQTELDPVGRIISVPRRRRTEEQRDTTPEAVDSTERPTPVREVLNLGCWNCGGPHRYAACPNTRRQDFCYGCGRRNATVRTCPRCGPTYEPDAPAQEIRGPRRTTGYEERNGHRRDSRATPYP